MNKYVPLLLFLFTLTGACKSYIAHVYSGIDPAVILSKSDPIFFVLPDNPSIRERNVAVFLKDELLRNGFNVVEDKQSSVWTMSFAIDRQTYTIGSTSKSSGLAVGFDVHGVPLATGTSRTKTSYVQQTDVMVFLHLLNTSDVRMEKPIIVWEGSVRTALSVFKEHPNGTIKALLDKFGRNFESTTKVYREYQRNVNRERTHR